MQVNRRNGRNLRNDNNLVLTAEFFRSKNKITEFAAIEWNNLHQDLRNIVNRNKFKDAIKNMYLKNYV